LAKTFSTGHLTAEPQRSEPFDEPGCEVDPPASAGASLSSRKRGTRLGTSLVDLDKVRTWFDRGYLWM
ncbi:MAG: hypothetical protein MUO33_05600, partial [Sedimentisphaerales bacterium]|nr:hypothetical protein [Sedimentisphaerales bacterium]